ncbi:hypothetical protein SASPL_156942 [Salvia splendens]|uniref:F-box domain-containing protein n=1 Tax=Salvia splendens TaxID=180675 RepID=A0A8X8VW14_SALSN|nr:putative F-box protein At3g47150 [Salvia splendens]KAG6383311.1 hypothetical protein SASPL_156942 [Salvia splendens]
MNIDVVFEILLHLPILSLLRFRAVCKLWCNVIDSPHFITLHTLLRRNNNRDEEVYLRFTFGIDHRINRKKVSINLLDNWKTSLKSHDFPLPMDIRVVSEAVKGLVCLSSPNMSEIAICKGQFKILPLNPYNTFDYHNRDFLCCDHYVGLGFDEHYKVVQLIRCMEFSSFYANLCSARTNSWSKLDVDRDLFIEKPIKSLSKNVSFCTLAHKEME